MTTALAKPRFDQPTDLRGLQALGRQVAPRVELALPPTMRAAGHRMLECLYTVCQANPALLKCRPITLFGAVLQSAQLGLELGGPAGQCYLVPFKGSATLLVGYRGFINLAHRSGRVKRISPTVVRAKDHLRVSYGSDRRIEHEPLFTEEGLAAPVIAYYTDIELVNGGRDFDVLSLRQAEEHRDRFALSKNGPWKDNFDQMALKTTVRSLLKRMPISVHAERAVGVDELGEAVMDNNAAPDVSQNLDELFQAQEGPPGDDPRPGDPDALRERVRRSSGPTAAPPGPPAAEFERGDAFEG